MEPTIDVVGVGNAIVDVIVNVDEAFIETHGLQKGAMTLIDADRAESLYAVMPPGIEASGGSAANTMAGVASFGGSSAYIGKVRGDQLGEVFRHDIRAARVAYEFPGADSGPPTARCLIQVTPDAERTMNTFLGISAEIEPSEIDTDLVRSGTVLYCEGYLWDIDSAKDAIRLAMDTARDAGRLVSLTLSDDFCVQRHREEWLDLLDERVDLVFGNEGELCSLYETASFDEAVACVAKQVGTACITRGKRGSLIVAGDQRIEIEAYEVDGVVDTTGAGDLYASGFLYGMSRDHDLETCGKLASLAAAEIISHLGARPATSLERLALERLGVS